MLSWKAILIISLVVGLILISYMRDQYKNTLSILGGSKGWPIALASAYRPLYFIFGFANNEVAPTVSWWMENGHSPTPADAVTIETLMSDSSCNPAQAWSYVQCDINITPGTDAPSQCAGSPCGNHGGGPSPTGSLINSAFQYGVPALGLALMLLG